MSLIQKPIEELEFSDLRVRYGTGRSIFVSGSGRDKKYRYRYGVMTNLGDLEISEWKSLMKALIEYHGEQELQEQIRQWSQERYPRAHRNDGIEQEALELHAARIFDNPVWVDYIPFNRRYRPEVLKTAQLIWIEPSCCQKPGQITKEQLDKAVQMEHRIFCPHCGRCVDYRICDSKNRKRRGGEARNECESNKNSADERTNPQDQRGGHRLL